MTPTKNKPKLNHDLVVHAVEFLGNHMPMFGDSVANEREFGGCDPSLFMDRVSPEVSKPLLAACIAAAKYLESVFSNQIDVANATPRELPPAPWDG